MCEVNIKDLGADGKGMMNNSSIFYQAIEKCAANGGGRVNVPPGVYLTGPIKLKDNINLHLHRKATILFTDDFSQYPPVKSRWEGIECYGYSPCLYANELKNASITGEGVIDGNGRAWIEEFYKRKMTPQSVEYIDIDRKFEELNEGIDLSESGGGRIGSSFFRPPLVQFHNCSNVLIDGVTLRNSPFWNTHLLYCNNVEVTNTTFENPSDGVNGDGLDIDSCSSVRVNGCVFDVNDDCLCLKSGIGKDGLRVGRVCEDVNVTNCTMKRGHGGVVIGSETAGDIRNIKISDSCFNGTDRGIRIKSRRGRAGKIENLEFSDIKMEKVFSPVVINLYYECGVSNEQYDEIADRCAHPVTKTTPKVRNIKLKNIDASDYHTTGLFILGLPESPVEKIDLHNISMTCAADPVTGRPAMALGIDKFCGRAIFVDFVKDVSLNNISITTKQGQFEVKEPVHEFLSNL